MPNRPRLTPAIADVRRAVRHCWDAAGVTADELVLVGVSGGADSMALVHAAAFEGARAGVRVRAVVVEHGLQEITKAVALAVMERLAAIGVESEIRAVLVGEDGGPEGAARAARYDAIELARRECGARYVMLGHTLDDQAETVLLGLTRGSGARSISGMSVVSEHYLRPLLSIRRETTEAFCHDSGIEVWNDPHNEDPRYLRVRIRHEILPLLEQTMGPGVATALARTADQLRDDADALDALASAEFESRVVRLPTAVELPVDGLEVLAAAIRARVLKLAIEAVGGTATSVGIESVTELVINWHGQKSLTLPGARVERTGHKLVFRSTKSLKPGAC
jgi:tRNA(Ile)-lysidine synthase